MADKKRTDSRLGDQSESQLENSNETLETYHPRMLIRQQRFENDNLDLDQQPKSNLERPPKSSVASKPAALTNLRNQKTFRLSLRQKLSQTMARLSSLDSTRSSSSLEADSTNETVQPQNRNQIMPFISITPNQDEATGQQQLYQQQQQQESKNLNPITETQSRYERYNNYYGRSRIGLAQDKDDYDNSDDDFEDPPLPIPYSSSSMSRSNIVRQMTSNDITYPASSSSAAAHQTNYEDLLDDRQGMNNSEQQFTKGEKLNRPSLDGSIISELRIDGKKETSSGNKSGSFRKDKNRRSKSPTSYSFSKRSSRHSRKGILGFASRLKLTRKYDSIAKLQLSILNSGFVSLKSMDKDLQTFLPKERMTPIEFQERVKLMRKYEVLATIEYRFASRYETYVCRHATQESNQPKNNYKKCIPYDYNRVVLKTVPNVPDSDYINASHVDSYLKPNAYIAAQGPNENTIEDFWRMIWEQKTFVIVMLTKVFDFIRVMCNQYWPVELNKPERYGNLEVTLLYEEPLADFVIRTIKLTKLRTSQTLNIGNTTNSEPENQNINTLDRRKSNCSDSELDDEDDDEYEYDCTDDSSVSDELILNENNTSRQMNVNNNDLPTVRLPKFVAKPRSRRARGRQRESSSTSQINKLSNLDGKNPNSAELNTPDVPRSPRSASQPPNEFLHPLFNPSMNFGASTGSIPSTPNSQSVPRTPSSAGIDRSSATRKAVKKKRRARVKNLRPLRTQFQVPDEAQLVDDDDEDHGAIEGDGDQDGAAGKVANERIIYQFHYNAWASHTCPFISSLLHFRRRVRICMDEMAKSGKTGPTIVHCNDGCGRTGTYLCIDANLELAEEDNVYDVFNYTKKLRQSRKFLIENLEQYKFVYDTIEEAMFCGKTWFPVSELHKRLKHKSQRNPITKKNEYLREYEKITRMTSKFSIGDCAGGHRVENREKNRDVSTVPPDNFRPYLTSFQSNDNTDYINAVFVDGYTRSKEYIVTEWPSHKTISDFWSLIYDHECNSVILLANPPESSTYPSFLPTEKELRRKFGPVFSAEMVSYTHYPNIKSWIYAINKKIVSLTEVIAGVKSEMKTTQVFQITCWPQGHRVPTSTNALVELMNMVERWRQRTAYGPVCVVSLNGKSRAGVYCAANVAIEQVVQHNEVDVFQAVKTVRRHRPQLIENMTEYKYCYDLILHYVLHYVNQSPANS